LPERQLKLGGEKRMTDAIKSNELIALQLNRLNSDLGKLFKPEVITIRSPIYRGLDDLVRNEVEDIVDKAAGRRKILPRLTVALETDGGLPEVSERISGV